MHFFSRSGLALTSIALLLLAAANRPTDQFQSEIVWPEPPIINPGDSSTAPSDAIVLFDGSNLDAFENGDAWKIEEGYAIVQEKSVRTKQAFGDCQLHVEFATPAEVKGEGQGRGNSGIYMMGRYEIQILDSFGNKTYFDGQCGAIYKQQPPTVNASRGPGEWQSYDILFTAPRFNDDGTIKTPAFATVLHNGVLIHNHFELPGGTYWDQPPHYEKHEEKLPISIQNHGNPVRFRNIWLRENIAPLVAEKPKETDAEKPEEADGDQ